MSVDPDRMHQVLANLTSNALRFGPSERPVHLAARSIADGIELSVTDEGPGIADEEVDHIFERFYRAAGTGADSADGAGLGLAIAKRILDLHGSPLSVRSEPNAGASFIFTLPTAGLSPDLDTPAEP